MVPSTLGRFSPVALVAGLLLVLLSLTAAAQGRASAEAAAGIAQLSVTVRDSTGVVPGATVMLQPQPDGAARQGVTDGEGRLVFDRVSAGAYRVVASFPGFADVRLDDLTLAAGDDRSADLTLTLVQFSSQ